MKSRSVKMIEVQDWDALVEKTYGRPYSFQQQNGCQQRGIYELTVPGDDFSGFTAESIPEVVNGDEMGVTFKAWLARDPKKKLPGREGGSSLNLFWERNFYPGIQEVANDLHAKGLLKAGKYVINIDW